MVGTDELALDDENTTVLIIHNDGVHLLVVLAVRDIVPRGDRVAQKHTPEIPCNKSLAVIGEILLVVRVMRDLLSDLCKNRHLPECRGVVCHSSFLLTPMDLFRMFENTFAAKGWDLWDEPWLRQRLQVMSKRAYENQVSAVVAKLLLRGKVK